jgi:predicted ArsR family transcriptional regulator
MADELAARIDALAALAEPVRRELFRYVTAQDRPVTRDDAAEAVGVPRHQAKFHLDRLVDEGLLDADFSRPPGRGGPGAGRPSKRYRRSSREVAVSVPERRYDLAGRLMAAAIDASVRDGVPVDAALTSAASGQGAVVGAAIRARLAGRTSRRQRVDATCAELAEYGYEPRPGPGCIELTSCPFHALATEHTALVCGMNHTMLSAAVDELCDPGLEAELVPHEHHCCVVIRHD